MKTIRMKFCFSCLRWCGRWSSTENGIGFETRISIGSETCSWNPIGSSTGDHGTSNGFVRESWNGCESGFETSTEIWTAIGLENWIENATESCPLVGCGVGDRRVRVRLCGRWRSPFRAGWRIRQSLRPVSGGGR